MDEPVRPSRSGSWWTELGSALSLYVTEPRANGVQTALNFFPVAAALPQACGPGYEVPRVPYAALPEVGEELLAAYAGRTPAGPNTAGPALAEALAYAKARAYGRPGALPAVVLVTRGMPRDCALTDLAELARQGFENEPKARTSVVVLGASRDLAELHGVAASGGSEEAIVLPGDDPSKEFVEAMLRVQNGTGPCKYSIPELEGEPTLLRVFLSIGRERVILSRVEDRAACGQGGEGYYYDDNTAPLPFVLCPASCARKGDGKLSLEYGCD
jgi:hypothetical protein